MAYHLVQFRSVHLSNARASTRRGHFQCWASVNRMTFMLRQLRVNCAGSFGTKSPRTETFSARVSPPSTQSRSMIVCAAVIGQANNPLYIRCFLDESSESALKFHYIVHCSLDAIEEKVLAPKRNPAELQEAYLGLLYPTEDCKVFGYVTSTHIKFVLVVDDAPFKEDDIQLIHRLGVLKAP